MFISNVLKCCFFPLKWLKTHDHHGLQKHSEAQAVRTPERAGSEPRGTAWKPPLFGFSSSDRPASKQRPAWLKLLESIVLCRPRSVCSSTSLTQIRGHSWGTKPLLLFHAFQPWKTETGRLHCPHWLAQPVIDQTSADPFGLEGHCFVYRCSNVQSFCAADKSKWK